MSIPTITISLPHNNDTVRLYNYIHILLKAEDKRTLTNMKIELINCESGKTLYSDPNTEYLDVKSYPCDKTITSSDLYSRIDKLTKLKLYVMAENELNSVEETYVYFYVEP